MTGRQYDHCQKVGNKGDVWKHYVLCEVVEAILGQSLTRFVYAETHCGRLSYALPKTGEWQVGIGRFGNEPNSKLGSYFELNAGKQTYLGSSGLVAALCKRRRLAASMYLWDVDCAVVDSVVRESENWNGCEMTATCGDGYDGVLCLGEITNLVLVDPPYHRGDWQNVMGAVPRILIPPNRLVLVWYPIYWPTWPEKLTIHLAKLCKDVSAYEVMWGRFGPKPPPPNKKAMKGCGMVVVGPHDKERLCRGLPAVAERLDGGFQMRSA
jgi:23S rRNA A2030 N6-methylase RlmJ